MKRTLVLELAHPGFQFQHSGVSASRLSAMVCCIIFFISRSVSARKSLNAALSTLMSPVIESFKSANRWLISLASAIVCTCAVWLKSWCSAALFPLRSLALVLVGIPQMFSSLHASFSFYIISNFNVFCGALRTRFTLPPLVTWPEAPNPNPKKLINRKYVSRLQ